MADSLDQADVRVWAHALSLSRLLDNKHATYYVEADKQTQLSSTPRSTIRSQARRGVSPHVLRYVRTTVPELKDDRLHARQRTPRESQI